ncbi:MAG: hypothetical protein WCE68_06845 [Anaerolineales bacterium]
MKFDPKIHPRHAIRLQAYDYFRSGAYYGTIVAHGRECLFGQALHAEMQWDQFGLIERPAWSALPDHPHIALGAFGIVPNHVHAVILLNDGCGRGGSIGNAPMPKIMVSSKMPLPDDSQTRPYASYPPNFAQKNAQKRLKTPFFTPIPAYQF